MHILSYYTFSWFIHILLLNFTFLVAEHSQNTEKESETTVTVCFLTKWHTCILLATNVDKRIWPE